MAGLVRVRTQGDRELRKRLKRLPADMKKKVIKSMMTSAGTVVAKQAKREAPVKSGLLKGSIIRLVRNRGQVVAIGPEYREAPHDHLVHDGTRPHSLGKVISIRSPFKSKNGRRKKIRIGQRRGNKHPGSRPNPYMQRAMDKSRQAVFTKMAQVATKRIAKLRSK